MKLIFALLLSLVSIASFSQPLLVSGKVIDRNTKEPLVYASISLKGKSLGTITNTDGTFDFYISIHNKPDTLLISMLGYGDYEHIVGELKNPETLEIGLKLQPIILDETVIKFSKMSGQEIMIKAYEKIEQNFPMNAFTLKAFYREMYEENNITTFVTDAVVDIKDSGYKAERESAQILRERLFGEYVRSSHKQFRSIFNVEYVNYLKYSLRSSSVRYRDPDLRVFLDGRTYELDSLVHDGDHLLYVISSLKKMNNASRRETYYIDADTYAIRKHITDATPADGTFINQHQYRTQADTAYRYQIKRRTWTQEYDYYKGKLYLKYIKSEILGDLYNRTNKQVEYHMKTNIMLVVTDIQIGKAKTKGATRMSPDVNVAFAMKSYKPEFWNTYEEAKQFPLTRKQASDLEREMPLEKQFEEESHTKPQ